MNWALKLWDRINRELELNQTEKPASFRFRIKQKLKLGQTHQALQLMLEAHHSYPENMEFLEQLWDQAVRMGKAEELNQAGQILIERLISKNSFDLAYFHWKEWVKSCSTLSISLEFVKKLCFGLLQLGRELNAQDVLGQTLDLLNPVLPTETQYDLVSTASHLSPWLCQRALRLFLDHGQLSMKDAQMMRGMLVAVEKQNPNLEMEKAGEDKPVVVSQAPISLPDIPQDPVNDFDPFSPSRINRLSPFPTGVIESAHDTLKIQRQEEVTEVDLPQITCLSAAQIRELGSPLYIIMDLFLDNPMVELAAHQTLRLFFHIEEKTGIDTTMDYLPFSNLEIGASLLRNQKIPNLPEDLPIELGELPLFPSVLEFELNTYGVNS